jgi:predicted metal-binding membrane protein
MALLVAFGVMNLGAMIALATVAMIEKVWVHGVGFSRAVGVLSLSAAAVVVWVPQVAPGLEPAFRTMGM